MKFCFQKHQRHDTCCDPEKIDPWVVALFLGLAIICLIVACMLVGK